MSEEDPIYVGEDSDDERKHANKEEMEKAKKQGTKEYINYLETKVKELQEDLYLSEQLSEAFMRIIEEKSKSEKQKQVQNG